MAALLLLAALAGYAPQAQEQPSPQTPAPAPEEAMLEVAAVRVSPELVSIQHGENKLTVSSKSIFPTDVEAHLDAVVVNYGWGDCTPEKILRKDDHTLEVTFLAKPASDKLGEEELPDSGYIMVAGVDAGGHNPLSAAFSIAMPELCDQQTVARGDCQIALEMKIENAALAEALNPKDIRLSKAFAAMRVTMAERRSSDTLSLTLEGEMATEDDAGMPYLEGRVTLLPGATTAAAGAYGEAHLATPAAYI